MIRRPPRSTLFPYTSSSDLDHADVRLRLRPGIERDRSLSAHVPPSPESRPQGVLDEADGRHVGTALGLLHQHEAVEQLEPLVGAEEAALDELFVLRPTPAPHADRARVHHQGQSRTLPSPASTSTGGYVTGNGRPPSARCCGDTCSYASISGTPPGAVTPEGGQG